jgi:hypothetical protein
VLHRLSAPTAPECRSKPNTARGLINTRFSGVVVARKTSFTDELKSLVERYGLKWREDKTVETVGVPSAAISP